MGLSTMLARMNPFSAETRARFTSSPKDGAVPNPNAVDLEDQWMSAMLLGAASAAGVPVTPTKALGVSTVFSCVSVLSSAISTLPLMLYRRLPNDGREVATDHYLYDLLHNMPNPDMTSVDFRTALQSNLSLRGNAYAIAVRNLSGRVVGIYPLENKDVTMMRDRVTRELIYRVQYDSRSEDVPASDIIHLKGMTLTGYVAPDMLRTVRDVIGLAVALDDNAAKFFRNGSFPGGFLEHPGKLTPEAADRLRKSFESQTGGANAHRVKVLEEGLKFAAGRTINRDAQMDESRDRQAREIARLYRVPGHKVGIVSNQPRANVEQENLSFVTDTLRPICVAWEQAMNAKLLTERERREYYFEFNLGGLLRGDVKTRFETYDIGIRNGIYSPNECRKLENMNPREGGDVYLQPLNMTASGGQSPQTVLTDEDT